MALRNSAKNLSNLKKAREGDEDAKRKLQQFAYNIGHVEGKLAGCKSIGSFFFHDVDCYEQPHPQPLSEREGSQESSALSPEEIKKLILEKKDEIGLMMLERSASGGWHLVCKRVPGTTILENQVRVATLLHLEMDTGAKDLQRVVFSTSGSEDDLVYLDDALFTEPMTPEECEREYNRLKVRVMRKEEQVPAGAKKGNKHYRPWEGTPSQPPRKGEECIAAMRKEAPMAQPDNGVTTPSPCGRAGEGSSPLFKGTPYATIIAEWWKRNGGEPQEGERNVKLYQLAVNLRAICDNDKALLMQVMPRLGLDEREVQSIVDSACKEPVKGISKQMREILGTNSAQASATTQRAAMEAQLEMWGEQIEALFPHYPILRDVCKGLKRNQYPAALFVAGGLMMTLMTRCTYRFYHRPEELRRLNNCTLIIGDPASGKSFATRLFKLLAAPIVKADKVGKDAINAYREQIRSKGANKDKPQKPKVVVRLHPARTSNAQFIQDMVNSVEVVDGEVMQLHMLTFDTELDNTVTVQKGGSWIDKQSLELKAFHNEEDGQAYSNNDSILQDFYVTWNFIYTGTPIALKKKVNSQNFGSGLATRLSCIPLPSTNFRMMDRETTIDYESDERLKEWAFKLDRTKGELSVQKLVDELYDWTARRMEDAGENESFADEMLLKRCAYHGLNFSAPFVVMRHWAELHQEGDFWCGQFQTDETDWELAELITNIQLTCQRYFFGAMAEQYFDDKDREASYKVQRRSKTIEGFKNLPEEFTVEDVMRCFGIENRTTAKSRVQRFQKDHLVEKIGEFVENGFSKARYAKTNVQII